LRALSARGPDGARSWRDGSVGLCHLLLQVTREDLYDSQPLNDQTQGLTLVADIRLDNREELAALLAIGPESLASMADSAILMAAYKAWGEDCVTRLLGDFAYAIWDGRARKLVLARDHMGQRSLFYYRGPGFLAFASEPNGLWALPDVPRRLSDLELGRSLISDLGPNGGAIHFEEILGLLGGTWMRVDGNGEITRTTYWSPRPGEEHLGKDVSYYIAAYRKVLTEAVACRLRRTIKPAGLFMSGGFDSAAIAGLAGPVVSAQSRKLVTVTLAEPGTQQQLQSSGAGHWASICSRAMPHLDPHYEALDGTDVLNGLERRFLQSGLARNMNHYAHEELFKTIAAAGCRTVMDGHGGDYTLNPRDPSWLARRLRRRQWRDFMDELSAVRAFSRQSYTQILGRVVWRLLPRRTRIALHRLRHGIPLSQAEAPITPDFARTLAAAGALTGKGFLTIRHDDVRMMMAAMLELQRSLAGNGTAFHAAAHGLEYVQPFHDKRVVELALAIPDALFVKGGRDRYLARRALADIYPAEFQTRFDLGNDARLPQFWKMIERIKPRLLDELARQERNPRLRSYFDFARIRAALDPRGAGHPNRDEAGRAVRAILYGRYLEWLWRDNAGGAA
jgi:asparagine synthase (glutamine-hydrolysing)